MARIARYSDLPEVSAGTLVTHTVKVSTGTEGESDYKERSQEVSFRQAKNIEDAMLIFAGEMGPNSPTKRKDKDGDEFEQTTPSILNFLNDALKALAVNPVAAELRAKLAGPQKEIDKMTARFRKLNLDVDSPEVQAIFAKVRESFKE